MAAGEAGIRELLEAEQAAATLVADAREARVARLRQADDEAQRANETYRAKLEEKLLSEVNARDNDDGAFEAQLKTSTEQQRQTIDQQYAANKDTVAQLLLHHVASVKVTMSDAQKQAVLAKSGQ